MFPVPLSVRVMSQRLVVVDTVITVEVGLNAQCLGKFGHCKLGFSAFGVTPGKAVVCLWCRRIEVYQRLEKIDCLFVA